MLLSVEGLVVPGTLRTTLTRDMVTATFNAQVPSLRLIPFPRLYAPSIHEWAPWP
jgi:hypothetical protein